MNERQETTPTPEQVRENSPLPEVVLTPQVLNERAHGIHEFLMNPPKVDCVHVLGRSGILAATGLSDNPTLQQQYDLPTLIPIDGIGNEVWLAWKQHMHDQDLEDEIPDEGIGELADDETRAPFAEWVRTTDNTQIQATIASLRALPSSLRRIAILDDMKQSGNVTMGVAPALYTAAYGEDYSYDPDSNHYLFTSSDWLAQIIKATFTDQYIDDRQLKFLVEVAKGATDWPGFRQFDAHDVHSLDQLAQYCATQYLGQKAQNISADTVYTVVQKYGENLFSLHEKIQDALRKHTDEVIEHM